MSSSWRRLVRRARRSELMRSVSTLSIGEIAAQALLLAAIPFITRLYPPEDFGVFGVFVAVSTILGTAANLRYELAIVLPATGDEAAQLLTLTLGLAVASGLVAFAGVSLLVVVAPARLGEAARATVWLIPAAILVVGLYRGASLWLTRQRAFRPLALVRVTQAVVTVTSQILLAGSFRVASLGLCIGFLAGWVAAVGTALAAILRRDDRPTLSFPVQRLRKSLRQYRDFPKYSLPAGLINSLSGQLPVLVLASAFSTAVAGQFSLAMRVVTTPPRVLGDALRQVMTQRLSYEQSQGRSTTSTIRSMSRSIALVSAPIFVLAGLAIGPLFDVLFGSEWNDAALYAILLLPLVYSRLCVQGVSILFIHGKQKLGLVWQSLFAAGSLVCLSLGALWESPSAAVVSFSIFGAIMWTVHLSLSLRHSRRTTPPGAA